MHATPKFDYTLKIMESASLGIRCPEYLSHFNAHTPTLVTREPACVWQLCVERCKDWEERSEFSPVMATALFGLSCPLPRKGEPDMDDSKYTILLVEDEENDAMLLKMAFKRNNILNPLFWVKDG